MSTIASINRAHPHRGLRPLAVAAASGLPPPGGMTKLSTENSMPSAYPVWGYTTGRFQRRVFSEKDHAWLDSSTRRRGAISPAEEGYDLVDDKEC